MSSFRWMELNSRQFKRYILEGGDLAALPVGSMEVMGPHLPVGVKYFIARALAEEICRVHNGLCLPAVPLSPITGKKEYGGVSLDTATALNYIRDAVNEAHENGIRRMLLVGNFDELYYVSAEVLQEEDIPMTHIDPMHLPFAEKGDFSKNFNALAAGSLKILGEEELLQKTLAANEACYKKGGYRAPDDEPPVKGLINVLENPWRSGVFPHFYGKNEYKVLPVEKIDADAAAETIRAWVKNQAGSLEALSKYSQVFPRTRYDRGLRMGGVGYEK